MRFGVHSLLMRVSGFTFLKNGTKLGYPYVESIRSVLPIVDEFVVALGACEDDTADRLAELARSEGAGKLRLIPCTWNTQAPKAFVYAAQSLVALYNCTGDWALYLQGDEAVHEDDHANIRAAIEAAEQDDRVEGLVFDYIHFYGSAWTVAESPAWYRREVRIVRNRGLKIVMPSDAQYFTAIKGRRRLRYLNCRKANARMFHYGWARAIRAHEAKQRETKAYYQEAPTVHPYALVDATIIRRFEGTHPAVMRDWVRDHAEQAFTPDPNYILSRRDKRQRVKMFFERTLGIDTGKDHFKLV